MTKTESNLIDTLENGQVLIDEGLRVLKLLYQCADDSYNSTSEKDPTELVCMHRHFPYLLATLQLAIDRIENVSGTMINEVEATYSTIKAEKAAHSPKPSLVAAPPINGDGNGCDLSEEVQAPDSTGFIEQLRPMLESLDERKRKVTLAFITELAK